MNELLFECYAFPHVAYGIDGTFSYSKNMKKGQSSVDLVIHVIRLGLLDQGQQVERVQSGQTDRLQQLGRITEMFHFQHTD